VILGWQAITLLRVLVMPLVVGMGLMRALGFRATSDRIGYWGWSWIGGTLVTALVLFGWLWWGLPSVWGIELVLSVLAAGLFVLGRRVRPQIPSPAPESAAWEKRLFLGVLTLALVVCGVRILLATGEVVHRADEATFWSFHAKVIFENGGFTPGYTEMSTSALMRHPDYPLLNPLLQLWTYLHYGAITHVANRVPIQMFSLALVLVLGSALRRAARGWVASALLIVFLGCGYALVWTKRAHGDVLVGLGALVLLDGYFRHRAASGESAWWRLSLLGACLCLWSKNEGMLVLLCALGALALAQLHLLRHRDALKDALRPRAAYLALLAPLLIIALNSAFNAHFDYRSDVLTGEDAPTGMGLFEALGEKGGERLPLVASYFWNNLLLRPSHSGYVLLAFLLIVVIAPKFVWQSPLGVPALALIGFMLGVFVVFLGTGRELDRHLRSAAARVLFQCVPAVTLWLAVMYDELCSTRRLRSAWPGPPRRYGTKSL